MAESCDEDGFVDLYDQLVLLHVFLPPNSYHVSVSQRKVVAYKRLQEKGFALHIAYSSPISSWLISDATDTKLFTKATVDILSFRITLGSSAINQSIEYVRTIRYYL